MNRNHLEELENYIKKDKVYQDFVKDPTKEFSDFDMFCIEHCQDIEYALAYFKFHDHAIHNEHVLTHTMNDIEDYINDEIKKQGNLIDKEVKKHFDNILEIINGER